MNKNQNSGIKWVQSNVLESQVSVKHNNDSLKLQKQSFTDVPKNRCS